MFVALISGGGGGGVGGEQRNCIFRTIYQQFVRSYFSICDVTVAHWEPTFKSQKQTGSRQTGHKRDIKKTGLIYLDLRLIGCLKGTLGGIISMANQRLI